MRERRIDSCRNFWFMVELIKLKPNAMLAEVTESLNKPAHTAMVNYRQALGPLRDLYGDLIADEFGPLKLRAVREAIIKRGWARTNINTQGR